MDDRVLLAILTGLPGQAGSFFTAVAAYKNEKDELKQTIFKNFLRGYLADAAKDCRPLALLQKKLSGNVVLNKLNNIPMRTFNGNLELVRRFSFRDMGE